MMIVFIISIIVVILVILIKISINIIIIIVITIVTLTSVITTMIFITCGPYVCIASGSGPCLVTNYLGTSSHSAAAPRSFFATAAAEACAWPGKVGPGIIP